jgi:hypothetical protein
MNMRFRFLRRAPSLVRASLLGATVNVNGEYWGRFEDVIPEGQQLAVAVDSLQEILTGRTRARWTGWSNGGPRVQTLTSGASPDTLIAGFQADHRVLVQHSGTGDGTVTSSVAGNVTTGIFVAEGTPVTLTAAPGAGAVFGGWRGDSTSASASITLPRGRPYDMEALFLAQVTVAVADATTEILGTPTLTVDQRVFLDQLGNKNGLYDLGDYLALLARSGQTASPAVMQAILSRQPKRGGAR